MGGEVAAFRSEIASLVKAKHALGISSGTDAILLALMALDIGRVMKYFAQPSPSSPRPAAFPTLGPPLFS